MTLAEHTAAAAEMAAHDQAIAAFKVREVIEHDADRWRITRYVTQSGDTRWSAQYHHAGYGRGRCGFRSRAEADGWMLAQQAQIAEERQRQAGQPVQESFLAWVERA